MVREAEVTVIVPIYNVAEYLDRCVLSILGQTYYSLQIILVDDGSTDDSGSICDKYKEEDSRVVVIHKQNEGLVQARKTGVSNAKGKYICYVDGDDWIEPDMIESFVADIERTQADLIVSNYYCETEDGARKVQNKIDTGIYNVKTIIPIMLYTGEFYEFGISQFVWAKLYRKDILHNVQMQVDGRICCGEDVAVTYPYILQIDKIFLSDYTGYHYLQRLGSMTNHYSADEIIRNKLLLDYLWKIFEQSIYAKILYGQLNQYAKNLLLVRQIGCFDTLIENTILSPYGGISMDASLVIYGAGKLGQSIYNYLKKIPSIKIVEWLDKNYVMYQKMHCKVNDPAKLRYLDSQTYDYIIIAINNTCVADRICRQLIDMGVEKDKIRCLVQDFIKEENCILDKLALLS